MNQRKKAASDLIDEGKSERRACELIGISRSQLRYETRKKEDPELVKAILKIKAKHCYYGLPRVHAALRRQGFVVNGKKIYRLLRTLNLNAKRKMRVKRDFILPSRKVPQAIGVGEVWSMDFVFDRLANGSPFRCLTIIDTLSREVPGIYVSSSMAGFSPVDYLETLRQTTQLPRHFILDNGPEFANRVFIDWCTRNNISVHFIDPGKPVQNAYVESFNGKFRQEFLNLKRFPDIKMLRHHLKNWITYYNDERPHSSLDYLTPKEFANLERGMVPA